MRWWQVVLVLACGCATVDVREEGPALKARSDVEASLASLPTCPPAVDVGRLVLQTTACTERLCKDRVCCNACEWNAYLRTATASQQVDPAVVRELLELSDSSLDCEVDAWKRALAKHRLSLRPACVAR